MSTGGGDTAVGRDGPEGVRSQTTAVPGVPAHGGRRRGRGERTMVPDADFVSYYGRPIVKPAPWEADIPAYLFAGGLAAGSSLLAAGADLTGRPVLRRSARLAALGGLSFSMAALVHDLGKPSRFLNMLRVAKLTSPMSVGTWILSAYGPPAGLAAAAEVVRMLPPEARRGPLRLARYVDRPAGLLAALLAPPVASYTAVLLSDTSTPSWHEAYRELPFVFVGSAAAAASGLGLVTAPLAENGPARRLAVAGAVLELTMEHRMEQSMGITAEPLHQGRPGRLMRAAKVLTAAGAAGALLAGRSRLVAAASGAALLAGSWCTRFGIFEAGQESARDPKYTVVPQRRRLEEEGPVRYSG
ncbi:NrfD/PsrC family molybdoenzyme membrane anchor subunit [Nocardioides sp. TF02-7]|uniref:NrfD/PsrC family molybdoenzyme membrane anchor subunit n=1 Tax=Nocardioides sp. TF02-7 TaxID=2917724 RepID=UPI001F06A07A|nr:NrfD/PsrC family molybdoenzyme membrane anchor subunit [Nocardioides sp. TF02-7]UMG93518.1 polysulfide reductase NrfD [Nocardioides sp. TF02-7]